MWLMKTLLTSGCTNQRGAGHKKCDSECSSYLVNAEMVKNGYAWAYRYHNVPSSKAMEREENEARKNRLGLWRENEAIEPWKWRHLHNQHKE